MSFRFGVTAKGTTLADFYIKAKPGSIYEKVYKKHMTKEESFVMPDEGVRLALERPDYAYSEDPPLVLAIPGNECKVC